MVSAALAPAPDEVAPPPPLTLPAAPQTALRVVAPRRPSASALCPLHRLQRIAVFRPLMLGEMLCALPALQSIRRAVPQAKLTLIGLPWCEPLARRLASVDDFLPFPGVAGRPTLAPEPEPLRRFVSAARQRKFDLVLQMQGAVWTANRVTESLGARMCAGFYDDRVSDEFSGRRLPLHTAWPRQGHESHRLQQLLAHLGMPTLDAPAPFPLRDEDRQALAQLWPGVQAEGRRYVCIHPGAAHPYQRWPVERFAAVADHLANRGWTVVVTGGPEERGLAERLCAAMRTQPVVLTGLTTLWTLAALIERAALLIGNDTGVSVLADALGTTSLVVSGGNEVERWAPADRRHHYVLWQHDGDSVRGEDGLEPACARMIRVAEVSAAAEALLS
jgi:ADP-heptose:LPS heptosyltransferase